MKDLEGRILEILSKKGILHFEELMRFLGLEGNQRKTLKKTLRALRKSGKVVVEKGKFRTEQSQHFIGKVLAYQGGFGFLQIGKDIKDIYIPPFEMNRVFDGDLVSAKAVIFRGKTEARILKVLKRARKEITCSLLKTESGCFAVPVGHSPHQKIQISKSFCSKLKEGTLLVVKLGRFYKKLGFFTGSVKEVLGHPQEQNLILELIIRKYNLRVKYPQEALEEIESLEFDIEKELSKRRDLRDQLCFTIDPPSAKDFDDAVGIEKLGNGYRLFVHIADVSAFVEENSAIDKEALARGFTFYLPGRALHMLPEKLSSDLCSLVPNLPRLAMTCEMEFDNGGNLRSYELYQSVIVSKARLTYDQALEILLNSEKEPVSGISQSLRIMEDLYRLLSHRRWERGSIDFDLPETELIVDEFGEVVAVEPYQRHITHRIIEQFMVQCNEVVAMHLLKSGYPCLFRVHEQPDPEKVQKLIEILSGLGYRAETATLQSRFFQKILEDFESRPEENLVRFLTLRSMKRAHYSPHNVGHFGLASEHYTHFTSPIRRYADLVVHRLVKKSLEKEQIDFKKVIYQLESLGEHLSLQEKLSEDAEREAIDRLKVRFMRAYVGYEFDGIITGVIPSGFFVEISQFLVEGLVNISTLKNDHYLFDEPAHRLVGVRSGKVFRLGDRVRVLVAGINEERAKLELMLV
ncbi:MAG: ribonuclease R [Aquificaceae bacterium]